MTSEREEIQRRARRRHAATLIAIAVLVPVLILVLHSTILRGSDQSSHATRSDGGWAAVVGTLIAIVIIGGATALLIRRGWRKPASLFATPLAAGLPRRQRRSARRNIRRGTPSPDPTQRAVERETATHMVQTSRVTIAIFAVFFVLELVEALASKSAGARTFFTAAAVVFVAMLALSLIQLRGARVYLAKLPE